MPHTRLLASGSQFAVDPVQSQLAQLDLTAFREIRLSVGNWIESPGPVVIAVSHIALPNTPSANLITSLDSFTLAPGGLSSRLYEVPGEVVVFLASPEQAPLEGLSIDFTIYGRTD